MLGPWTPSVLLFTPTLQRKSVPLQERYAWALYFAAMLWIILALFLGEWVSLVLLRHVF